MVVAGAVSAGANVVDVEVNVVPDAVADVSGDDKRQAAADVSVKGHRQERSPPRAKAGAVAAAGAVVAGLATVAASAAPVAVAAAAVAEGSCDALEDVAESSELMALN